MRRKLWLHTSDPDYVRSVSVEFHFSLFRVEERKRAFTAMICESEPGPQQTHSHYETLTLFERCAEHQDANTKQFLSLTWCSEESLLCTDVK